MHAKSTHKLKTLMAASSGDRAFADQDAAFLKMGQQTLSHFESLTKSKLKSPRKKKKKGNQAFGGTDAQDLAQAIEKANLHSYDNTKPTFESSIIYDRMGNPQNQSWQLQPASKTPLVQFDVLEQGSKTHLGNAPATKPKGAEEPFMVNVESPEYKYKKEKFTPKMRTKLFQINQTS